MNQATCIAIIAVGMVGLSSWSARPARGEDILNFKTAYNARFRAGYGSQPITEPPARNESPLFLLAGQDLSGIGWVPERTQQNVTMISPLHFAQAGHLKARSPTLVFFGEDDQLHEVANKDTGVTLMGDASVGSLVTPLPNSYRISYVPIIDRGDTPADYQWMTVYIYGPYAIVGQAAFNGPYRMWGNHSADMWDNSWSFGTVGVRGGDSSSPSFAVHDGQMALIGTRSGTWGSSFQGGVDAAWFNAYTIAKANALLAPAGYAVKVLAVPKKHWSATAGSDGDFNSASNWAEGAAPGKEAVSFDGSRPDCRFDVHFSATPMLRGITFERAAAPGGFTFSGSAVQIGTGGIVNNNAHTQTFNNDVSMHYLVDFDTANPAVASAAQHWSANAGDLVFNGAVTNHGFQLVVDGARDTAINGPIAGAGGLGKEGTGKLTLTAANLYSGNTTLSNGVLAVNNSAGSGTGSGNVIVWGGRIQGSGAIGGPVTFNAIGDDTTLAPGNADLGLRGTLTLQQGVTLSHTTSAEFHLDGPLPGSEHDQLVVQSGDVDLGGAALSLSAATAPAPGTRFWLINNTGTGALLNRFAGLDDGATFLGGRFEIHYNADFASDTLTGGNDVVVIAVPEPAAAALVWPGLASLLRRPRRRAVDK